MYLSETTHKNFRNLKPRRLQWHQGLNVLSGPNGSGKTNILESLNVLSGWGPFPVSGGRVSSMTAWDEKTGLLLGNASGERDVEIAVQIGERLGMRANNERVTYSELRSLLPSLSFLPGDVSLLDGSPSVRRLFLDKLCALCSPAYARRLAEYRQLIRQRASLLRRPEGSGAALRASATPIARLGGWIRLTRIRAVEILGGLLDSYGIPPVEMNMKLSGGGVSPGFELEDYVKDLKSALDFSMEREYHAGLVLVGPHRDDLAFSCEGRPAAPVLSRGQKRRAVAAAIIAAGRLIEMKLRMKPILILDDIAAELDADGRSLMGQALLETGWQVFAAGVEDPFLVPESAVWHVSGGSIAG